MPLIKVVSGLKQVCWLTYLIASLSELEINFFLLALEYHLTYHLQALYTTLKNKVHFKIPCIGKWLKISLSEFILKYWVLLSELWDGMYIWRRKTFSLFLLLVKKVIQTVGNIRLRSMHFFSLNYPLLLAIALNIYFRDSNKCLFSCK